MTSAQIIAAVAQRLTDAGYAVTAYDFTPAGQATEQRLAARRGRRVANVHPRGGGSVFVAMSIDYGEDGTSHCDHANLKSPAAVVRRITRFLA